MFFGSVLTAATVLAQVAKSTRVEFQCWANGFKVRSGGGSKDHLVYSRFSFNGLLKDDSELITLKSYMGHIAMNTFADVNSQMEEAEKYALFHSQTETKSSLSPDARKYTDDKYFRFRKFAASQYTGSEADFFGEMVIEKRLLVASDESRGESFRAHYVAQAGDHYGGTIDYTCKVTK